MRRPVYSMVTPYSGHYWAGVGFIRVLAEYHRS